MRQIYLFIYIVHFLSVAFWKVRNLKRVGDQEGHLQAEKKVQLGVGIGKDFLLIDHTVASHTYCMFTI